MQQEVGAGKLAVVVLFGLQWHGQNLGENINSFSVYGEESNERDAFIRTNMKRTSDITF